MTKQEPEITTITEFNPDPNREPLFEGIPPQLEHLATPIDELHLMEGNPRQGDVNVIEGSLKQFGLRAPIVYRTEPDPDTRQPRKVVYAGNHRLLAATNLGWSHIAAISGDDLTHDEIRAFSLADNRTGDLGEYDDELLAALLDDLSGDAELLAATGYDDEALEHLIGGFGDEELLTDDPDTAPDVDGSAVKTKLGDVWLLGRHRIVCGDSTTEDAYHALFGESKADVVWTDPPYGVSYVGKTAEALTIENDELDEDELEEFLGKAFDQAISFTKPGANWWVAAPSGPLIIAFALTLRRLGIFRQMLAWVKNTMVLGRSDYHYQHESIFYGWTPGAAHTEPPDRKQTSVLKFDKPSANREHPTMKPIDLIAYGLSNSAKGIVLDPFSGSGSTLIASQTVGRTCYGIELDPKYCDVICRRFQNATGIIPVLEPTGEEHDFSVADDG